MRIVIDIDEELYNYMQTEEYNEHLDKRFDYQIRFSIKNGTPLPKGHGKIKDIDKIEWYGCTTEFDCPHKDRECKDCNRAECSKTQVDAIPTIIDADKERD